VAYFTFNLAPANFIAPETFFYCKLFSTTNKALFLFFKTISAYSLAILALFNASSAFSIAIFCY